MVLQKGNTGRVLAYGKGKIVYNLLDATTVAADAETGEGLWRTKRATARG